MATRRRRTTKSTPEVVETTHEEMLEVAEEREAAHAEEEKEEEVPIEVIMSAALADTFEAIYKAEVENGVEDFFQVTPELIPPAPTLNINPEPKPLIQPKPNQNLVRKSRTANYRRG